MSRLLHTAFLILAFISMGKTSNPVFSLETSQSIAFVDTIRPVIFCPGSIIVNLLPMRCDTVLTYTVNAFDDQGTAIIVLLSGIASGGAFPSGATVNTFLATDLAGNSATCSFTVTAFEPTTQPVCRPMTNVFLGQNCTKNLKAFELLEGGPYGCASHYVVEVDKIAPPGDGPWVSAMFGVGDIDMSYQVRVTALLTNAVCWGIVKVKDNLPPVFNCQNIDVPCVLPLAQLTPAFLRDSFGIATAIPTVSDGCSGNMLAISFTDIMQSLPCNDTSIISGIIRRIWSATDLENNTSTCEQIIRRRRILADVQIPSDKVINCSNPDFSDAVNGRPFIAFQNRHYELTPESFCEIDAQKVDSIQSGSCAGNYTLRRTWKIFDACLPFSATNPKIGVQKILVKDTTGPVLHCPADMIFAVTDVNCRGAVDLPDAFLSDNCSALTAFQAFWTDNGQTEMMLGSIVFNMDSTGVDTVGVLGIATDFPIGTTTLLYTAEDACGNFGECSFNLTLTNLVPPTAVCDALHTTTLPDIGFMNMAAAVLDNGSSDDCSPVAFKAKFDAVNTCHNQSMFTDTLKMCCRNLGDTLSGVLRVYDVAVPQGTVSNSFGAGHFTDCNFKIVVSGPNVPFCTAPADVSVSCEDFNPMLGAYGGIVSQSCAVDSISIFNNMSLFDTLCARGTISRVFRVFDAGGQMNQCVQTIVVNYEQDYYIRFPDDVFVTVCAPGGVYGQPTFFGKDCEQLTATYQDKMFTMVPDACFRIERTWRIVNLCTYDSLLQLTSIPNPNPNPINNHADNLVGPIVSPIQDMGDPWRASLLKVGPTDPLPTNFADFYAANANGYQYKQIIKVNDTQKPVVQNCPDTLMMVQDITNNNAQLWNASYWLDPLHLSMDLCETPTELSITARDNCAGSGVTFRYQLFLDLNGDGIRETAVSSNALPPSNTVFYNNASGGPGEARQFDFRPLTTENKWRFALQTIVSGDQKTAYLRFNSSNAPNTYVVPQLPYGAHKIKWFVTDDCGNETICEYNFTIRDGKPPTVLCLQSLSTNILPTGMINLFATDFLQYADDNCTPNQFLVYSIRKGSTGTSFPTDNNGNPQTNVTFACSEIGPNPVQLWCRDRSGNAGFCLSNVMINDNSGNCNVPDPLTLGGFVKTAQNVGIAGVSMNLEGTAPFAPPFSYFPGNITDTLGRYSYPTSIPVGSNFTITPLYDQNPLNGVTTFDLVLISKHILGIEALSSPYKLIAADANKSGSITTFDIVELRKLILGIYQELPFAESWRFVPTAYVFPNPLNPFVPAFPEEISIVSLMGNMNNGNFVGMKTGDVNYTAVTNAQAGMDARSAGTQYFNVSASSQSVKAGAIIEVVFSAEELLEGCQFTLNTNGLEVLDVLPGENMGREHFGLFPEKNTLTMAWEKGGQADFTLKCKAIVSGNLREMLSISSRITKAEAYQQQSAQKSERFDLALKFPELGAFELYQNRPNPFEDVTEITFNLPEAAAAKLIIYDINGRVLYTQTAHYEQGTHTIGIEKSALGARGVFYYQVETEKGSATRKMIKI